MKFKNISIKKRILFSNMSMIFVPILIIAIIAPFFIKIIDKTFVPKDVTTAGYNTVGQMQWDLAVNSVNSDLSKNGHENNDALISRLRGLEKSGALVLLLCDGKAVYSTNDEDTIIKKAEEITDDNFNSGIVSVSPKGFISVTNTQTSYGKYRLMVVNENYKYDSAASVTKSTAETAKYFALRFGIIILVVVCIFVLAISIISFITTMGIIKPINQLKKAAKEISDGNLDYEMEYDSTNEFGVLVNDFDQMRLKLKDSIEKQERLERQRKEMVAGFSHDLRTPLTSVKGYVEGLMDGIARTPEKQQEYLKTIYNTANDMQNMVNELFLFSKLDVDKVTLEKENVAIVNYLADFCEEEKFELEKLDIDIIFTAECDRMTTASIDRNKFGRVLLNIISNSIKYRKPDVKGLINVSVSKNEKYVIIKISDNGIGIDNESLKHIFETFYRADPARTNVREGSGIGLSICKQIIDLHDGNIWATGEVGVGMTVNIAVPLPEMK